MRTPEQKRAFIMPTIKAEGLWSDDAADRGGETVLGITRAFDPNWPGWKIVDAERAASMVDGKLDTDKLKARLKARYNELLELALPFYVKYYYDSIQADSIEDDFMAKKLFDIGVNMGKGTSIKNMQESVGLEPDGKITPELLKRLNITV